MRPLPSSELLKEIISEVSKRACVLRSKCLWSLNPSCVGVGDGDAGVRPALCAVCQSSL